MTYEDREHAPSYSVATDDPHSLLFGPDDHEPDEHDDHPLFGRDDDPPARVGSGGSHRRRHAAAPRGRRRRGRTVLVLTAALVAVVAVVGWLVVGPLVREHLGSSDYTGTGTGSVTVEVHQGDAAATIGSTLKDAGVVKSVGAFTSAAAADPDSAGIQPGIYRLRSHMSGAAALALMLTPSARTVRTLTIPEGRTLQAIEQPLATALGVPLAQVRAAAQNVPGLGIPSTYTVGGRTPSTVEGFLYPDTYTFDPSESPSDALQDMITEFAGQDRSSGFATKAAALHVTPYQALIIASMIQGEAKFADDQAKVARVIYNRLAAGTPLGIDATSIYGAELAGKSPATVTYQENSPYNTRIRTGLPPTPIGNPGQDAMAAAVAPAAGSWIYYVNGDAAGHLAFFSTAKDFEAARLRCVANHWGCT